MSVYLSSESKFRSWDVSLFSFYYLIFGDTMFDTYQASQQVSFLASVIFGYLWVFFGINVLINITLAQVEDGYLEQQSQIWSDWLTKSTRDPYDRTDYEALISKSITFVDIIKNI